MIPPMAVHRVEPSPATLHGHFSRDLPPVLTIDPGDTVSFRTLDAGGKAPEGDRLAPPPFSLVCPPCP